jgi:hypothetical protein
MASKAQTAATAPWIATADALPPEGKVVLTKIDDWRGARNEQTLKRHGRLWFDPDGSVYVYYTPTHWREVAEARTP